MTLVNSDRSRFPVDPWKLVETSHTVPGTEQGLVERGALETLFALGNGHLGVRGAHPAATDSTLPGSFINGFYEIWDIQHAENAYGFARQGQRILYLPDAHGLDVVVDGEALTLTDATVLEYRRTLDFASGLYECRVRWQCRSGAVVTTVERRAVGQRTRGALGTEIEISADRRIAVDVTSTLVNRQDLPSEDHSAHDPRRSGRHAGRVLTPVHRAGADGSLRLAWETTASRQRVGVAVDHLAERRAPGGSATAPLAFATELEDDGATVRYVLPLDAGEVLRVERRVSYALGASPVKAESGPAEDARVEGGSEEIGAGESGVELAARAAEGLLSFAELAAESADHFAEYWAAADVRIGGQPELQQAVRWNLFQLGQATAQAGVAGIPAKGVSGSGYEGHYFWDQEIYLLPYLTYTAPDRARKVLESRYAMLPAARARAEELSVEGALFPWRTIGGQEASAYYAAGTAQFHINAAIAFAVARYFWASGDEEFRATLGAELLTETARMWISLGFFGKDGRFHIHGVTGPDEYTAVVNDNLYTNVMARFNLRAAAALEHEDITDTERLLWQEAAERMALPYDVDLQLYAQDNDFMTLEPWDWATPRSKYPLLLHFHPLVIYRHQVLKQADAVLAMFLQWQEFSAEDKQRAFDFYDPITTGDSTLSACVQGIVAAEVGYGEAALSHFTTAAFIDLDDIHHNTVDGVHIASAGGVWSSLVCGFAGLRDQGEVPFFDPRLPVGWSGLEFGLRLGARTLRVALEQGAITLTAEPGAGAAASGAPLFVDVRGERIEVGAEPVRVALGPTPVPEASVFARQFPTSEIPIVPRSEA